MLFQNNDLDDDQYCLPKTRDNGDDFYARFSATPPLKANVLSGALFGAFHPLNVRRTAEIEQIKNIRFV